MLRCVILRHLISFHTLCSIWWGCLVTLQEIIRLWKRFYWIITCSMENMNHYMCLCLCVWVDVCGCECKCGVCSHFLFAVMGVKVHVKRCSRRNEANGTLDTAAKNAQGLSFEGFIHLCVCARIKLNRTTCLYGVLHGQKTPKHL